MREPRPVDAALIWSYLTDAAAGALAEYFNSGKFTGGRFEHFAGGGDRHGVSDQFTSDDIVAVSMLSVRPGESCASLVGCSGRVQLSPRAGPGRRRPVGCRRGRDRPELGR